MPGLDREFKASQDYIAKYFFLNKRKGRGRKERRKRKRKEERAKLKHPSASSVFVQSHLCPHKGALYTSVARHTWRLHSEASLFRWNEDQDGDKKAPLLSLVAPSLRCVSHPLFRRRNGLHGGMQLRPCSPGVLFVPSTEQ